jgi:putative tricarboxylic transport membrane protein
MTDIALLIDGFETALSAYHVGLMIAGVLLGILVGVLPGLGAPNGVALLLPLTLGMEPISGIIMLSSMYWGALFGGSTTSILFNIPGEPSSIATTFDGYPLARQGRAAEALATAFVSAGFGALAGVVLVTVIASSVASIALRFAPPEHFAVYLLAFCSFIGMGGSHPVKTMVSLLVGLALAAVGTDTMTADVRLTFGSSNLLGGIDFLVAVIGLFGIGEILVTVEQGLKFEGVHARVGLRDVWTGVSHMPRYAWALVRSTLIGCWMGITPGGPTAASFMAYGVARRFSRRQAGFGRGEIEGVVSPEAADHSAGVSALRPMLVLGVPGSATAAVMMGGLIIWGLQPGPLLLREQPEFVWGLIASMYLANVVAVVLVLSTVPLFASILRIPFAIIGPLIIVTCLIGAYTLSQSMFEVALALAFGVVGYFFKKLDYPVAPLVLAMVLGDRAEVAFRQSMLMGNGSMTVFFSNSGIAATFSTLALFIAAYPLYAWWRNRRLTKQSVD